MDSLSPTLSIRQAASEYRVGRDTISRELAKGEKSEIPHRRIGPRRVVFLRADFEDWIRGATVRPTAHAEDVVAARLERERANAGPTNAKPGAIGMVRPRFAEDDRERKQPTRPRFEAHP